MAIVRQIGEKAGQPEGRLDPALKEFLDEVLIPALVKKFILEQNQLASVSDGMTEFALNHSASAEGVQ